MLLSTLTSTSTAQPPEVSIFEPGFLNFDNSWVYFLDPYLYLFLCRTSSLQHSFLALFFLEQPATTSPLQFFLWRCYDNQVVCTESVRSHNLSGSLLMVTNMKSRGLWLNPKRTDTCLICSCRCIIVHCSYLFDVFSCRCFLPNIYII